MPAGRGKTNPVLQPHQIVQVLQQELENESFSITELQDCSSGWDQQVCLAQNFVIKMPLDITGSKVQKEVYCLQACAKHNILAPQYVKHGIYEQVPFVIQKRIAGTCLHQVMLQHDKQSTVFDKVFEEWGRELAKMHHVDMSNQVEHPFTKITERNQVLRKEFEENAQGLQDTGFFDMEFIEKLRNYFAAHIEDIESNTKLVLVHSDAHASNVMVEQDTLTSEFNYRGMIDFADADIGIAMQDLPRMFIYYEPHHIQSFLQGYGEINLPELNFFIMMILIWFIPSNVHAIEKRCKEASCPLLLPVTFDTMQHHWKEWVMLCKEEDGIVMDLFPRMANMLHSIVVNDKF